MGARGETAGRLAGTVRLQDLGPMELRNIGEPVRVFRLAGPADNPLDVRARLSAGPADRG